MFDRFTSPARRVVVAAQHNARRLGHSYIGTEHMLLGMVQVHDGVTAQVFDELRVTLDTLDAYVLARTTVPATLEATQTPVFTPRAKNVLELALRESLQLGHNFIGVEHLLLGALRVPEATAAQILSLDYHINLSDLRTTVIRLMMTAPDTGPEPGYVPSTPSRDATASRTPSTVLDQFGINLTAAAQQNLLDPVSGRFSEIERVTQILARRSKNNPILIGEPGVGKTAIVEGLAQAIASGSVPGALADKQIYTIDLGQMIAGARYRGDFEERFKKLLKEVVSRGDVILFLDEIHTIIGAGSAEGSMDAASMLKPMLSRGELQTIGATTLDEYRKHFEKDAALTRRFQTVVVDPPSPEETIEILKGLRPRYESHHQVLVTDEALSAAVELADRYIADRFFPDKAIDLIDEAGSRLHLRAGLTDPAVSSLLDDLLQTDENATQARQEDRLADAAELTERQEQLRSQVTVLLSDATVERGSVVTAEVVAEVLSAWTKIPLTTITQAEASRLLLLEDELHHRVVGQNAAVSALARSVRRSRAGLRDKKRPSGSFIFLGPSGVGKTELAKALAETVLGDRKAITMLDMSEYMEKHSVSRLIGSPPGYVGYDEAGQLTEAVRRRPFSVILFDEIEKAHPDVFNALLQILEEGHLTDSQGRTVEFANTFIVMTSNLGTEDLAKARIGFSSTTLSSALAERSEKAFAALKKHFRPEFLNRVDDVLVFDTLTRANIADIVDLMLESTHTHLATRSMSLHLSTGAKELLINHGYDATLGARPLRRAIQRYIEDPLSESLLRGKLNNGDAISGDLSDDGSEVVFLATPLGFSSVLSPKDATQSAHGA
jgi:ATP-dependent Clp protease ATP-binding subunit ClpC